MKRILVTLMIGVFSFASIMGCQKAETPKPVEETASVQEEKAPQTEAASYTYQDAAERTLTFEKAPERIAVTYFPLWEALLMLDVKPIAASNATHYIETWPPLQGMALEGIEDIGNQEVNLEKLAGLKPDLIMHQVWDPENIDIDNFEKLSDVAVFSTATKMDWRLSLREVGKLLNREDRAEAAIADVDKKLEEARDALRQSHDEETVLLMSMMGVDKFVYAYRGDVYDKETGLGVNMPEGFAAENKYDSLSMEALVEMNPDYLFVNVFPGDEKIYEEVSDNPVWQSLKAVKNGRVYKIDGPGHSPSPLSTVYTIDFIIDKLNQ